MARDTLSAADRAKIVDLVARETGAWVEEDGSLGAYLALGRDDPPSRPPKRDRQQELSAFRHGFGDRRGKSLWRRFEVRPVILGGDCAAVVECTWQIWLTSLEPGGGSGVLSVGFYEKHVEKVRGTWQFAPGNKPGSCRLWRVNERKLPGA